MNLEEATHIVLSVLGIFTIIILITRLFGLRTFAKMSSFDFASTIAVGSILASIILNGDQSLLKGGIALLTIILFQTVFSFLTRKVKFFNQIFTNKPQVIMWKGEVLHQQLKKCNVSEEDLIAKLRESNVLDFNEVQAVVFESTGDISVLHNNENKTLSEDLLNGVATKNLK